MIRQIRNWVKFHTSSIVCPICSLLNYLMYAAYLSKYYSTMLGNHQSTASNDFLSSSDSKKTVRRGCSLINWIFRRGPDYVRLDSPAPSTGQPFARPLIDICEDGDQSAPVLVSMIFCLLWPHYFYRIEHFQILSLTGRTSNNP